MEIINGTIYISGIQGMSPAINENSHFRDGQNNNIMIENSLIIRLYEMLKYYHEKNGSNFEDYCNELFNKVK